MAWNDVKPSTNKAVHLLVTIDGRQFNFRQATDIKVERKIGDTMSKFSLGIIDDSGSDQRSDYIEFERYLLNRFTEIEVMYGNSYNDLSRFQGFVVDYQPVFFGNTTKLTVTGYLTKVNRSTSSEKLQSPYSYWYDWTPYLGVRKRTDENWDEIFTPGKLKMNSEMNTAALALGASTEINENVDLTSNEAIMRRINEALQGELNSYKQVQAATEKTIKDFYYANPGELHLGEFGVQNIVSISINWDTGMVVFKYTAGYWADSDFSEWVEDPTILEAEMPIESVMNQLNDSNHASGNGWDEGISNNYNSFQQAQVAYYKQRDKLLHLAVMDALAAQDAQGVFRGATPFHPDIMSKYTGNVEFVDIEHPYTHRKISRVRPDLFIKWDNVVPLTNYTEEQIKDMDYEELKKAADEFSNHVICDIKIFGLRYIVNQTKLKNRDIANAFVLLEDDRWGTKRVYGTKNGYYIWVGDIPELWIKHKQYNGEYQAQKTTATFDYAERTVKGIDFVEKKTYEKGTIVINSKGTKANRYKRAEVVEKFTTDKNPNKGFLNFADNNEGMDKLWKNAITDGNMVEIEEWSDDTYEQDKIKNNVRDYKIYALRDNDGTLGFINDKDTTQRGSVVRGRDLDGKLIELNRENRIKIYLQSAFRSAMPLAYGEVRISDIVKQLAYLEKWDDNEITGTTSSSYNSAWLCMNGQSALEYISETLGPNAVEAGGGRVGFTTYFDKNKFVFRPINMQYTGATVFETGYNRKNSDVISFTMRSRGLVLMTGVNADVASLNAYTNQSITASSKTKSGTTMSEDEARLRKEALDFYTNDKNALATIDDAFFNLPLYYFYGNSLNDVEDFANFLTKVNSSSISELPFGDQTIVKLRKSSTSTSTEAVVQAISELNSVRNTCIQAEMTIMGHSTLAPGQWITINNYTKRGPHYTSGDYFIQSISDQVSSSGGFTQSLSLWRFGEDVAAMSNGTTRLDAGLFQLRKYGADKFNQWFQYTYPEDANYLEDWDYGYGNRYGDNVGFRKD